MFQRPQVVGVFIRGFGGGVMGFFFGGVAQRYSPTPSKTRLLLAMPGAMVRSLVLKLQSSTFNVIGSFSCDRSRDF